MAPTRRHSLIWKLVYRQHGVIARWQLLDFGMSADAIRWRIARGRLNPVHRGVYAVGRPGLTAEGRWMAAVLACGPGAFLSHLAAAAHWRVRLAPRQGPIDVSIPSSSGRHPHEIRIHRRRSLAASERTIHDGIPITTPIRTLIDLATVLTPNRLESAVNEADSLNLVDPESLRAAVEARKGQPGTRPLRVLLDRHTFRLTESELERRFLRLVRMAGLRLPDTQVKHEGRTDFHWPDLGLVVETDGWRYHRTPSRQARDNRRMQAHVAAGRTAVRFSHHEIAHEESRVVRTLTALARRLASRR